MLQSGLCRSLGCGSLDYRPSKLCQFWVQGSLGYVFLGSGILGSAKSRMCQSGKHHSSLKLGKLLHFSRSMAKSQFLKILKSQNLAQLLILELFFVCDLNSFILTVKHGV